VGISHNTAPLEIRERLSVDNAALAAALPKLKSNPRIEEAVVLSTCNRTEVYAVTRTRADDEILTDFLAECGGLACGDIEDCLYKYAGHHAAKHLLSVACGLDSLAFGETQILGQVRSAYGTADRSGCTGPVLNALFQKAASVGKRARTQTAISRGAFSIGAAAVELARFVFTDLAGRKALLIGAGQMSKLAATHLKAHGIERVYVANRRPERMEALVRELGAEPIGFDEIDAIMRQVDVVISATGASSPIITRDRVEQVVRERGCAPLFMIDIAVPRDIEPEAAAVEGVFVYNIDDLRFLVERSRAEREAEAEKVLVIIERETECFMAAMRELEAVPIIRLLRDKFESVYECEWEKASSKLSHLPDEDRERVRRAIRSAVKKLTHDPIIRVKEYAADSQPEKLALVRELFDLD